ncbi:MAG: arginine deiminase family protein [Candidatus Peribacteraceae bacterium]|nr:arginine deiminase family protein [Candidatus Peribacteraceae bacterium]
MDTIPVSVRNEFDPLKTAIALPDPRNAIDLDAEGWKGAVDARELALHPETGEIVADVLRQQHQAYIEFLRANGVQLIEPPLQNDAFCQVFARDPGFAVNDTLFLASMRDDYRFPEVAGVEALQSRFSRVVPLTNHNPADPHRPRIEGGDVMPFDQGNAVLIGTGQISNEEGFDALARELRTQGMQEVVRVPHEALHLDCCFAPLPNGQALASSQLPPASRAILKRYFQLQPANEQEASRELALNTFWLNPETVVGNARAPETNARLQELGYNVRALLYDQLTHEWGAFRCTVCPIERK